MLPGAARDASAAGQPLPRPDRPFDPPRHSSTLSPMADLSPARGRWAFRPVAPQPRSIITLIREGTLDTELAATLWLLLEARVPLIVAAEERASEVDPARRAARLPAARVRVVELAGEGETSTGSPGLRARLAGNARPPRRRRSGPPRHTVLSPPSSPTTCRSTRGASGADRGPGDVDRLRPRRDDPCRFARRRLRRAPPAAGPPHRRRAVAPRRRPRPARGSTPAGAGSSPPTTSGRSPATSTATSSVSDRRSSRPGTRRRTPSSISAGA